MKKTKLSIICFLLGSLLILVGSIFQNEIAEASTTSPFWQRTDSTATGRLYYNNGTVGIGTSSTTNNKLQVVGGSVSINPAGVAEHHAVGGLSIVAGGSWKSRAIQISPADNSTDSYNLQAARNSSGGYYWYSYGVSQGNYFTIARGPDLNNRDLVLSNNGNIGINTTTPDRNLEVNGGLIVSQGTPTCVPNGPGYSFRSDGCYDTGMFSTGDGDLRFYSNQNQKIHVSANGDVCIGSCN